METPISWASCLIMITSIILTVHDFFLWGLLGRIQGVYLGLTLHHCEGIQELIFRVIRELTVIEVVDLHDLADSSLEPL